MPLARACVLLLALAGCAGLRDMVEAVCSPSRTEAWCCPQAKVYAESRKVVLGGRCAW